MKNCDVCITHPLQNLLFVPCMQGCVIEYVGMGKTQGSTLQQCTNKTLTTIPFSNTCEADEISPEVEEGGVVGLKCLKTSWDTDPGGYRWPPTFPSWLKTNF
jgi:hypothetical protein